MTVNEQILTIASVVLATMLTRFLPFLIIGANRETPKYIQYLGKIFPCAIFALLIVYCLRNVDIFSGSHGLPEFLGIIATVLIHLFKRKMLLSMAVGTAIYIFLVQFIFV